MENALIGFSGFVGSTILKQARAAAPLDVNAPACSASACRVPVFNALYRSTNIQEITKQEFDIVLCAGAPAQKWLANKDPEADRKKIDALIQPLRSMTCKTFILISTVDVFNTPIEVNEATAVEEAGLHAYGLHRRYLERFVAEQFAHSLIVRLPGLVGPGLRKNVIFDLLHDNNLHTLESRSVFQFYPMVNLWYDLQTALQAELRLVHLTAEPISVADLALQGFGKPLTQTLTSPAAPARYDMQTRHATLFGAQGPYQYSQRETLQAIRAYAQSEPTVAGDAQT